MSAAPVLTSNIDVEIPQWLVVPDTDGATPEWRAGVLQLFEAIVQVDRDAEGEQRVFADGREVDPVAALDTLLEFRAALDDGERLVASLGIPNRWPLPVIVSVGVSDPDGPGLLELAGAEGGLPVERPAVDELPEGVGGEGPIVTRYDLDDDGVIWASICAVRRETVHAGGAATPDGATAAPAGAGADGATASAGVDIDTRVLWRTRDLDVVPVFGDELVRLLAAITNGVSA